MKKFSLLCALVLTLVLTGCGEKKLICQYKTTDSFQGDNEVGYKVTFDKNDKPISIAINSKSKYGEKYLESYSVDLDTEIAAAKEFCTELEATDNVSCSANLNNNTITLNVKYNVSKMSDEAKSELGLTEIAELKYADIKTQYEGSGFTCK